MKYKRIIFISLLLLLIGLMCLFVFAEKEELPKIPEFQLPKIPVMPKIPVIPKFAEIVALTWDKTYGGNGSDQAYSLIQTTDGGYAVAGATFSKGRGDDLWIIKLDSQGNKVWDIIFGSNGDDWGYFIIQTTDGGYAVVMAHSSEGVDGGNFYIMKVDAQGNLN